MKKLAPNLLIFLSLVLLFLVGCDWLLRTSNMTELILGSRSEWVDWHTHLGPYQQWVVSLALILLPILALLSWIAASRDNSIRTVTSSGDIIRLTPLAIERIVCREVRSNVAEVLRVTAAARQGKKGPKVVVNVATSDQVPVPRVDADVRRETVRVLQHLLGVGDPSEVKIVVYDVQSTSAKTSEKRRRQVEKAKSAPSEPVEPREKKAPEPEKPKALPPMPVKSPEPPKPKPPESPKTPELPKPSTPVVEKPVDPPKSALPFPPKTFEAEAAKPISPPKPSDADAPKAFPPPPKP